MWEFKEFKYDKIQESSHKDVLKLVFERLYREYNLIKMMNDYVLPYNERREIIKWFEEILSILRFNINYRKEESK